MPSWIYFKVNVDDNNRQLATDIGQADGASRILPDNGIIGASLPADGITFYPTDILHGIGYRLLTRVGGEDPEFIYSIRVLRENLKTKYVSDWRENELIGVSWSASADWTIKMTVAYLNTSGLAGTPQIRMEVFKRVSAVDTLIAEPDWQDVPSVSPTYTDISYTVTPTGSMGPTDAIIVKIYGKWNNPGGS